MPKHPNSCVLFQGHSKLTQARPLVCSLVLFHPVSQKPRVNLTTRAYSQLVNRGSLLACEASTKNGPKEKQGLSWALSEPWTLQVQCTTPAQRVSVNKWQLLSKNKRNKNQVGSEGDQSEKQNWEVQVVKSE